MEGLFLARVPVVETGMLIRRPVGVVFEAVADPSITGRFWFTHGSGRLAPDARVRWTWEMYGVSTDVVVTGYEENERLAYDWGDPGQMTSVVWRFEQRADDTTFITVTETGFRGETGDDLAAAALGSMGGFTWVLAALKAYLEHGIVLTVVADRFPTGL